MVGLLAALGSAPPTSAQGVFADVPVPGKEWMKPWIEASYYAGITDSCGDNPLAFCPEGEVTRAETAVLVLRGLNYPNLPHTPPDRSGTFADVPVPGKEWMEPWIEEFFSLGITGGCGINPRTFCPERAATRAEVAVFLLRALGGAGYAPPAASHFFADVPVAGKEWMEPWIDEFYRRGLTTGCSTAPLSYCPERLVTRAEMAVFVNRAFSALPDPACDFSPGWSAISGWAMASHFEPPVVSATTPESVAIKVKAEANVDEVVIELEDGSSLSLDPYGGGRFCAMLPPEAALYDYDADDANHNFVGFLDFYAGGTLQARFNGFIGVVDENVPQVTIRSLAADAQASPRVFNLWLAGAPPETLDSRLPEIARRFYSYYADSYDFLAIVSLPSYAENRHYLFVRNGIQGTGMGLFDNSRSYGSAGRLMGMVRYPIGAFFDLGATGTNHEILHHFANWLGDVPAMQDVWIHWPLSTLANGILSIADASGQGVSFPWALSPLGDGSYRATWAEPSRTYNDMELYLMGLIPASEVGQHEVFVNQDQALCDGCILSGPTSTLRIEDVIAQLGPRVPAYPDAQRTFRLATIVVSMDRLLTPREMAFYDYFAARGEATEPLPYTSGFSRGTTLPFYLATGERATFVTSLGDACSGVSLRPGQTLAAGQGVFSCDHRFYLVYQGDGNLVLYRWGASPVPLWWTGATGNPGFVAMQGDGNFVIYNGSGVAAWHTHTWGHPGAYLAVQNDGNVVVYDPAGAALWWTGTGGQ